jgi:hypothetical protein
MNKKKRGTANGTPPEKDLIVINLYRLAGRGKKSFFQPPP